MNNYEQMREAILEIEDLANALDVDASNEHNVIRILEVCSNVLALPPRQCDIGTAEEHVKRFYAYCGRCDGGRCDHRIFKEDDMTECALTWAQMPYADEGGVK